MSSSQGTKQVLVPVSWDHHGRAGLPLVEFRPVKLGCRENAAILSSTHHDRVRNHGSGKVHPGLLHGLAEAKCLVVWVHALDGEVDVLVVVCTPKRKKVVDAASCLPGRPHLGHLHFGRLPPAGSWVEDVDGPQSRARGAAEHPELAPLRAGHRRGPRRGQGLNEHPALQTHVVGLDRVDDLGSVEAANSVYAALQLGCCTVSPGELQRRAGLPVIPEAVIHLKLAERLIIQILPPEDVEPTSQRGRAEVSPFRAHRSARPPALVAHVQDLHCPEMLVTIVATACKDEGKREEVDPIEGGLLDKGFRLRRVPRHRRCLGVAEEVQDCPKMLGVTVDENPAVAVATDLVPPRQERLQEAATLLDERGARCLEHRPSDVQVHGRLRGKLGVDYPLALCFEQAVLLPKLLVLVSHGPPLLGALLLHAAPLLVDPPPRLVHVRLDLPKLGCSFFLGTAPILADLVHLALLLSHELLPHR
mmetsp:Transcript_111810/g.311132  ORF Transcript_111810/g.311132 Transcript_111810/m.311132 type:complete len:475 (+) Transcript_111810:69-1493(+)